LAINKLFLGGTDWNGSPDPDAWKDYGYNLDHRISDKYSTGLCMPAKNAPPSTPYPDGTNGIDNSFGKNILPTVIALLPTAQDDANGAIADGDFTVILKFDGLGLNGDYTGIPVKLYAGSSLDAAPKWDGTDEWPVAPELLSDPTDIESSLVQFPDSYVNDNTWVSGSSTELTLSLNIQGFELSLTISKAVLSAQLSTDRTAASKGIIAGVLDTEVLITELRKIAGSFAKNLCESSAFDSIADQLSQASDILKDGTQNASLTCDGISVGLGFSSKKITLGGIGDEAPPAADPCDCGNGTLDQYEQCDQNATTLDYIFGTGIDDCTDIPGNFTGGTLKCNMDDCEYDTKSCTSGGTGGGGGAGGSSAGGAGGSSAGGGGASAGGGPPAGGAGGT